MFNNDSEYKVLVNEESQDNRIFTQIQKKVCWGLAKPIPGRDPSRWRLDPVGNPVLNNLRGCFGALCHEYDHIKPYSKGGPTSVYNCQVLQTRVNRAKSDMDGPRMEFLKSSSVEMKSLTPEDMDQAEMAVYGNVSKEFKDYKVKVSKHAKEKSKL